MYSTYMNLKVQVYEHYIMLSILTIFFSNCRSSLITLNNLHVNIMDDLLNLRRKLIYGLYKIRSKNVPTSERYWLRTTETWKCFGFEVSVLWKFKNGSSFGLSARIAVNVSEWFTDHCIKSYFSSRGLRIANSRLGKISFNLELDRHRADFTRSKMYSYIVFL